MRRREKSGWRIIAVGVVVIGLMGWLVVPVMAANETAALQEQPSGLGLGFEPRSLTSQPGGTVTSTGFIHRLNHHRAITVSVDLEKSVLPPGSEVVIEPSVLELTDAERLLDALTQPFQVTIKTPREVPAGAYSIEIKADDGRAGESNSNVVLITIEGGR
jgi:plastocyanin